jgi:hypothetical protein
MLRRACKRNPSGGGPEFFRAAWTAAERVAAAAEAPPAWGTGEDRVVRFLLRV